jgi:tRNA threonylcarbamoyladenosine biosynthesis protein TsaB
MTLLAIDTSTPVASVALEVGGVVRARREPVTTYSERLLAMIDALFAEARATPRSLAGVCCAAGPGSFTGLRMGLATAKGLCLATGAPLVLVPTLAAIASEAPAGARCVASVDAYRGELYAGVFILDGERVPIAVPDLAAIACRPEALGCLIGDVARYGGDGFDKHPSAVPAHAARIETARTVAEAVLRLGARRLAHGDADDPRTAAPLYVRPPAPEEKAAAHGTTSPAAKGRSR